MKKIILMILICLLALPLNGFALSFDSESNTLNHVTVNEYEMIKNLKDKSVSELEKSGYNESEIIEIKELNYIEELKKRSDYSYSELLKLGYSDSQIELLKSLKSYDVIPEEVLLKSSAEVGIIHDVDGTTVNSNGTVINISFSWNWNQKPIFTFRDAVGFSWSGDYICHENTVQAEIDYAIGTTIINTVDFSDDMIDGISPASNGVGFDFKMIRGEPPLTSWAKSGNGSFVLVCYEHEHNNVQLLAKYGHSILNITSIGITYGSPSISFELFVETADSCIKTYNF
ncbi:MAG: hypothetical protein SCJ93_10575 [Bacillota bacterium]|nr:hypothetical protein [Bacillota bacterium]